MGDKGELETSNPAKAFSSIGTLLVYHSVFSFTKSYNILKHRDLVACVAVCNSCEATWFRQP